VNFLGWFRPPSRDIDGEAHATTTADSQLSDSLFLLYLDLEKLGNPGWNWDSYIERVNRTEGLVDPPKEHAERNSIDTRDWKFGRDGPVKLSFPSIMEEGERRILEACIFLLYILLWLSFHLLLSDIL
jgi:hypothetical protein